MQTTETLHSASPIVRSNATWWLAKSISIVFSPPLVGIVGLLLLGVELNTPATWLWSALYGVNSILIPIAYIVILMRAGEISDFHMRDRLERIKPMKGFLLFFSLSWLVFQLSGAPYVFQVLALVGALQAALMLLITLRWKISGHAAGVAGFSALLFGLFGTAAAPALIFIPLVIWARVHLDRHDLAQSLAGAAAGVGFMLVAFALLAARCPGAELLCVSL